MSEVTFLKVMTKEKKNIKQSVLNFYEKAVKGIKKLKFGVREAMLESQLSPLTLYSWDELNFLISKRIILFFPIMVIKW